MVSGVGTWLYMLLLAWIRGYTCGYRRGYVVIHMVIGVGTWLYTCTYLWAVWYGSGGRRDQQLIFVLLADVAFVVCPDGIAVVVIPAAMLLHIDISAVTH